MHSNQEDGVPWQAPLENIQAGIDAEEDRRDLLRGLHHEDQLIQAPPRASVALREDGECQTGMLECMLHDSPSRIPRLEVVFVNKSYDPCSLQCLSQKRAEVLGVWPAVAQKHVISVACGARPWLRTGLLSSALGACWSS